MIRKIRAGLVTVVLFAVTVRILWWTVEPLVPYLIVGLVFICIAGFTYYRITRW